MIKETVSEQVKELEAIERAERYQLEQVWKFGDDEGAYIAQPAADA